MTDKGLTDWSTSSITYPKRLIATVILVNLFVLVLLACSLRQSRVQYEERAAVSTRNLSQVLETQLVGTIEKVDLALLSVADGFAHQAAAHSGSNQEALAQYIAQLHTRLPELDSLRMADARGNIVSVAGRNVNIADRDYFRRLRDDPKAGLVISRPMLGRISGKWTIVFARRVGRPDGSFAGAVYAVFSLQHLSKTLSLLDVGRHGSVALRDDELGLIVRYPEFKGAGGAPGQKVVSDRLKQMVLSDRSAGTYLTRTPYDNIERKFSCRKVSGYPLYIIVGFASQDYLAQWHSLVKQAVGLAAGFTLISLLASWQIFRNGKQGVAAMENLRGNEERFRTLFESSNDAVMLLTETGFLSCNQRTLDMFGFESKEQFAQVHPTEISPPFQPGGADSCQAITRHIQHARSQGHGRFDWLYRRNNGELFPTEVLLSAFDLRGERLLQATVRDISQRREAEAQIDLYREHLEELVKQRTEELLVAKYAAEEANRAKSQFMANMSHELLTPLNAIIGFSELTLQDGLPAGQQNYLRKIEKAGKSLLNMIHQILNFSQSEAGTLELSRTRFELDQVLARVIPAAQQNALEKGLGLLISVAPDLPRELEGDPWLLEQVLSHLLENAVKFTAHGEVALALELAERSGDYLQLRFLVRDSGIGMRPEQMRKLFQTCTQGDGSSTRKFGGTGVGLVVCQRCAVLMGGEITVESVPGYGSSFSLVARFGEAPATGDKTAKDAASTVFLSAFPWIDMSYVSIWAGLNDKLYRDLLRNFSNEQQDLPERLASVLGEGDGQAAERILHTVKGLGGSLGVSAITDAARLVERALGSREAESESLLRLTAIFREFAGKAAAASDEGQRPDNRVAASDIRSILDRLELHIRDCDGETFGYFESVVDTLRPVLPAVPWDEIGRLLERYEFDAAAGLFLKMIEEVER